MDIRATVTEIRASESSLAAERILTDALVNDESKTCVICRSLLDGTLSEVERQAVDAGVEVIELRGQVAHLKAALESQRQRVQRLMIDIQQRCSVTAEEGHRGLSILP